MLVATNLVEYILIQLSMQEIIDRNGITKVGIDHEKYLNGNRFIGQAVGHLIENGQK